MTDYRTRLADIKSSLASLNDNYFKDLSQEDKSRIIEISDFLNKYRYNPEDLGILNYMLIELNELYNYNKVDKKRKFLFKSQVLYIIDGIKNMLED